MHIGKDISHRCNYFWFQIFTDSFIFFLRWLFIKNDGKTFLGYIFGRSFHLKRTKTALPSNNAFSIKIFFFIFFIVLHSDCIIFCIFDFIFFSFHSFYFGNFDFSLLFTLTWAHEWIFFSLLVFVIIPANLRKKEGIFYFFCEKWDNFKEFRPSFLSLFFLSFQNDK